jgi:hypothetical protein
VLRLKPLEPRYEQPDGQLTRRLRRYATRHMPGIRKYKGEVVPQIEASIDSAASAERSHSNAAAQAPRPRLSQGEQLANEITPAPRAPGVKSQVGTNLEIWSVPDLCDGQLTLARRRDP